MARKQKNDFFWVSYSDLMTTLFFVMLVLFVITVVFLKFEQERIEVKVKELEQIIQLKEQFKLLEDDDEFKYLDECKKFVAKDLIGKEIFEPNKSKIKEIYISKTLNVGRKIRDFLKKLHENNNDFSYLVVIEGNMANSWDKKYDKNSNYGYRKSYERALAVYNLWSDSNINFRENNIEVLIAGSGFNGLCREEGKNEKNNKRFSIQIIPKIANNL